MKDLELWEGSVKLWALTVYDDVNEWLYVMILILDTWSWRINKSPFVEGDWCGFVRSYSARIDESLIFKISMSKFVEVKIDFGCRIPHLPENEVPAVGQWVMNSQPTPTYPPSSIRTWLKEGLKVWRKSPFISPLFCGSDWNKGHRNDPKGWQSSFNGDSTSKVKLNI